ncbi:MAG: winged helix-turn-helix domain-containing tetratricopeptide repeat protein [Rhizobiaceae bacterium]
MIFEFGVYALDDERMELKREEQAVSLQPQVLDLLVYLVRNRERVVSKDEIIDAIWDGRAISDGTLNARINAARRAVEDSGELQAVIRTVARKGFRFVADVRQAADTAQKTAIDIAKSSDRGPSLTVIPFHNLDTESANEYLADGLTEDVVTALSKLRGFFVTDRSTTFALKNTSLDARQIAEEMGVRYVLQGSVRSAGSRVRVTAQLIDTATGSQLWSERYDRDLTDIFAIQDELTESLVARLSPELFAAEHARLKRRHPTSLDAWECFVNALHYYGQQSQDGSKAAIDLLERAIELDPSYSQALGLYATILAWRIIQKWEPMEPNLEIARQAADRALLADTNDPWASIGRGYVSIVAREGDAAIMNYGHAVDLSPNFAYARGLLGVSNGYAGNADIARIHIEKAIELSPRDTFIDKFYLYLAIAEFQAANYLKAAEAAQRAIQLKPGHASSHLFRTAALGLAGEQETAGLALGEFLKLVPNARASEIEQTVLYYKSEDRKRAADGMRKAGLRE